MTTVDSKVVITEPGVYEIPAEDYHADPVVGRSLSSSGARQLLPPSCPAKFRYEQDHPGNEYKPEFNLGHAAHKLVLGAGPEFVVIDADSYRTKAAKEQRDEALATGAVPLLPGEHDQVQAMAAALRENELAATLLDPSGGWPEVSLVWRDNPTGVMCRARLDWLPQRTDRRMIIPDYKTAHSADVEAIGRAVHQFGYHQQAQWYLAGAQAVGLADADAAFVFVVQEKTPPYLVTVVELDSTALRIGEIRNRRALQLYAHCMNTGHWPAYHDGIALVSLPPWAEREEGEHLA